MKKCHCTFSNRYGLDDATYNSYRAASADRRSSVFCDAKALKKIQQSVSSGVKTAAESASTGVKNATATGGQIIY